MTSNRKIHSLHLEVHYLEIDIFLTFPNKMHASRDEGFNELKYHSGALTDIFQLRGGFVQLEHFDKHFVKDNRKKIPAFGYSYILDTLIY